MDINSRIKYLRKTILNLSQEDFSEGINISRANLGSIETGRIKVTDRVKEDICRVHNVSRDWLDSGTGKPLIDVPIEDEYTRAAMELARDNDELVMQMIIEYWKLDSDSKKLFKDFIVNIAKKIE